MGLRNQKFLRGIAINEQGECTGFYNNMPYGIASLFEQNRKPVMVLSSLFKTGIVQLPKRLGFVIKPDMRSLYVPHAWNRWNSTWRGSVGSTRRGSGRAYTVGNVSWRSKIYSTSIIIPIVDIDSIPHSTLRRAVQSGLLFREGITKTGGLPQAS